MNKNKYYEQLPQKRMAVGVIILNAKNELLIVKPTYKNHWSIPGGVIDKNESPRQACLRELKEETGLVLKNITLLCLDYMSPKVSGYPNKEENLQFIFYGGIIDGKTIAKIKLPKKELSEHRFVSKNKALKLVSDRLAKRLPNCFKALRKKQMYYLEGGKKM